MTQCSLKMFSQCEKWFSQSYLHFNMTCRNLHKPVGRQLYMFLLIKHYFINLPENQPAREPTGALTPTRPSQQTIVILAVITTFRLLYCWLCGMKSQQPRLEVTEAVTIMCHHAWLLRQHATTGAFVLSPDSAGRTCPDPPSWQLHSGLTQELHCLCFRKTVVCVCVVVLLIPLNLLFGLEIKMYEKHINM